VKVKKEDNNLISDFLTNIRKEKEMLQEKRTALNNTRNKSNTSTIKVKEVEEKKGSKESNTKDESIEKS